jgi:Flp pilus assembly protein TadB
MGNLGFKWLGRWCIVYVFLIFSNELLIVSFFFSCAKHTKHTKHTKNTNNTKHSKHTKRTKRTKRINHSKHSKHTKNTKNTKNTKQALRRPTVRNLWYSVIFLTFLSLVDGNSLILFDLIFFWFFIIIFSDIVDFLYEKF